MEIINTITRSRNPKKNIVFQIHETNYKFCDELWKNIFTFLPETYYYYPTERCFNRENYDRFIKEHASKSLTKYIYKALKDNDDGFFDCYTIGFGNGGVLYDHLWLIYNGNEYVPVLITDINSSSCYSMWSCGNTLCEERDEDDEIKWTTDELVNMVDNKYTFGNKTFRQFLKYMYDN
jgi:hypothetical protein